jgi:hypothetical protein
MRKKISYDHLPTKEEEEEEETELEVKGDVDFHQVSELKIFLFIL